MKHWVNPLNWLQIIPWLVFRLCLGAASTRHSRFNRALAGAVYRLGARRRSIVSTNMGMCFPELGEQERERLVHESYLAMSIGMAEMRMGWRAASAGVLPAGCTYELSGAEHLHQLHEQNRGALLLLPHLVHIELAARLLSATMQAQLGAVYRPSANRLLDGEQRRGRSNAGVVQQIGRRDIRRAVGFLRGGGALIYLPDQDYGGKRSVFAPFFGHLASTTTVPFDLAKTTGAALLMVGFYREDNGVYRLEIDPLEAGDDSVAMAAKMNLCIERIIRRSPADYLWSHRRFKRRPKGEAKFY